VVTLRIILLLFIFSSLPLTAYSEQEELFFREEFKDLNHWRPLHFSKIDEHTLYSIDIEDENSYLRAESRASASGIVFNKEFDPFEYPRLKWRWKVNNVYEKGDARLKSGDDYPIRVYIIFKYDPDKASFGQRIKYGIAKKLYGEYPPHSSLNYIWANRKQDSRIITNSYAAEAKMILLQAGTGNTGKWIEQEVDLISDYHEAFKEDPPVSASIAIMNDSDNTGERAISYMDYIEVYR
jgi:hypothetical protein